MSNQKPDLPDDVLQRQRALSRWDNEGGADQSSHYLSASGKDQSTNRAVTSAEWIELRTRLIALENLVIALLATASEKQLKLAMEMAAHISPRPGFTPHPLTIHAANHMTDLVRRSSHFR